MAGAESRLDVTERIEIVVWSLEHCLCVEQWENEWFEILLCLSGCWLTRFVHGRNLLSCCRVRCQCPNFGLLNLEGVLAEFFDTDTPDIATPESDVRKALSLLSFLEWLSARQVPDTTRECLSSPPDLGGPMIFVRRRALETDGFSSPGAFFLKMVSWPCSRSQNGIFVRAHNVVSKLSSDL